MYSVYWHSMKHVALCCDWQLLLRYARAAVSDSRSVCVAAELSQGLETEAMGSNSILNATQVSSVAEVL